MSPSPVPLPVADRPRLPAEYGVPASIEGLLAWERIATRLDEAMVYWIATSGPDGRPRVRPVDGLYLDRTIYVGGSPETRWIRDLRANPQVAVHLDHDKEVVILEGEADFPDGLGPELAARLAAASNAKYPQYGMKPSNYEVPGVIAIRPRSALAWEAFPTDVTRFRFEGGAAG